VSISHKKHLALALVSRAGTHTLGLDLEMFTPARLQIAEKVLTEAERMDLAEIPEAQRWGSLLLRFSVKEAIYKALAPRLKRWIDFHEAEVWPDVNGSCRTHLHLEEPAPAVTLEVRYVWLAEGVFTTVRAHWQQSG
jgi:phosphopantetheine--protein transferase-like protein